MDHSEAVQQMAAERYLLDELSPELRDVFEEHMFDCPECAFDLRAEDSFLREMKAQLPELMSPPAKHASPAPDRKAARKFNWFLWRQPAFAIPAFAALLAVVAYQNVATIPGMRAKMAEPRLLPWTSLHVGTRGSAPTKLQADRAQGAALLIDLPQNPAYTSYLFSLYDAQNKRFWSQAVTPSKANNEAGTSLSLLIPGSGMREGTDTLVITGVTPEGGRAEIDRRVLEIHFDD